MKKEEVGQTFDLGVQNETWEVWLENKSEPLLHDYGWRISKLNRNSVVSKCE